MGPRFFLDIFSGASSPLSTAMQALNSDCFTPIDLIHGVDILDDSVFESILRLTASGYVAAALAAPYCSKHSMATLRPGGPLPVRSPQWLDGFPENTPEQQLQVQESSAVHDRARALLTNVATHGGISILENPATSMTWLDPLMADWVASTLPFAAQAAACRFGKNWRKIWQFVSNRAEIMQVALSCPHDYTSHQQIAGVKLPDGSWMSRITAEYPPSLAEALAHVMVPFVHRGSKLVPALQWHELLPQHPCWPQMNTRVEDGGGLTSTAAFHHPPAQDPLQSLRAKWSSTLFDTKDCIKIAAHIQQGREGPPLSELELQPYLHGLLHFLHIENNANEMLKIQPGQPFRLNLWQALANFMDDPETPFFSQLREGVRLGVGSSLQPSPCWPTQEGSPPDDIPLINCTSSWKSALDHPAEVNELIQEEVAAGFIAKIPGGLSELQATYTTTAVGKLGLVQAEGRSPRLVVDSSISNVTSNTVIPNHMLLPRIEDVISCAPTSFSLDETIQLSLDVSKAHRRILIHPEDRGLLCFHAQDSLYQCKTLNFGARASGWYWGRLAGLMIRSTHAILGHGHALWQYVDDLLCWIDRKTAPLWASLVIVLFQALGIPLSWHKSQLAMNITWIGWDISTSLWVVRLPDDKRAKIFALLESLASTSTASLKDLQSLVGRLLWLTSCIAGYPTDADRD